MKRHRFAVAIWAAALTLGLAANAAADQPAALIIDVFGETSPAVAPFDELNSGDRIQLAADAEIIIQHYGDCAETHLVGGDVLVEAGALRSDGGDVIGVEELDCPEQVRFADSGGEIGAVVLRSADDAALAPRPSFIAKGADIIEIRLEGALVASLKVGDGAVYWPSDAPALLPGGLYEIRLNGPEGERVARATVRADAGPTILRYR